MQSGKGGGSGQICAGLPGTFKQQLAATRIYELLQGRFLYKAGGSGVATERRRNVSGGRFISLLQ